MNNALLLVIAIIVAVAILAIGITIYRKRKKNSDFEREYERQQAERLNRGEPALIRKRPHRRSFGSASIPSDRRRRNDSSDAFVSSNPFVWGGDGGGWGGDSGGSSCDSSSSGSCD